MAVEVASLKAVLDLDKKDFDTGLKTSQKELTGFSSSVSSAMATLGTVGAAVGALTAVTEVVSSWTSAAREAEMINRDLEQTIKSTGGAAGITADAARDLANSLSAVTNFEDDSIVKGEAMLLTFTKIGADVFPQATETMLDMAQKMGSDLPGAAIQLGKALNDPIKGISALQRVGVTFSATQKQQIKDFMAINDVASAQRIILGELATEFGGQARAAVDPVIQLQNAMGNLNEALGTYFLPILNQIVSSLLPGFLAALKVLSEVLPAMGAMMAEAIGPTFEFLGSAISDVSAAFEQLLIGVRALGDALGFDTEGVTALRIALILIEIPLTIIGGIFKALALVINIVGAAFQAVAYVITQVSTALGMTNAAASSASNWAKTLANDWGFLTAAMGTLYQWILNIVEGWRLLITTLSQPINLPTDITPGSPTPLENGLRGIGAAISEMPSLDLNSKIVPIQQAPTTSNVTNLNMGGQSFNFQGNNSTDQALIAMLQLLRGKLEATA